MHHAVFRNDRPGSNMWSNAEPTTGFAAFTAPRTHYDRKADVLSVAMREGEPKYVAAEPSRSLQTRRGSGK